LGISANIQFGKGNTNIDIGTSKKLITLVASVTAPTMPVVVSVVPAPTHIRKTIQYINYGSPKVPRVILKPVNRLLFFPAPTGRDTKLLAAVSNSRT